MVLRKNQNSQKSTDRSSCIVPFAAIQLLVLLLASSFGVSCTKANCSNADAVCNPLNGYLLYTDPIPRALALFWIRREAPRTLGRANLDGSNVQELGGTFSGSPSLMLVDGPGGFLYYNVDTSADVRRAGLDGSGDAVFATDATAGDPIGIALDRARDRLYFWNTTAQLRYVSLANGTGQTLLRSLTAGQIAGAYSEAEDVIYSAGGTDLRRVSVDGASEVLLNGTFTGLLDVVLGGDGTLYATDLGASEIVRINRDGTNKQVLLSGFQPGAVAFDTRYKHLYVCDQTNQRIFRTNETGGDIVVLVTFTAPYNPVACGLEITAGGFF